MQATFWPNKEVRGAVHVQRKRTFINQKALDDKARLSEHIAQYPLH